MLERNWLDLCHYGDCRVLMSEWPEGSADACVTDPPYGDTSLEWDRQVDGWIPQVSRVLKPAASLWVFGSMRFIAPLFAQMEEHGFRYSQDIVWEKQNGTGFHNDRFRRVHEHAVMFYRGAWGDVYHDPQKTLDARPKSVISRRRPIHFGRAEESHYTSEEGGPRLQRSVIRVSNEHRRAIHPTQKPVDIITPLIQYSVPPGGIVIDPFIGSLSTGIAAMACGRRWAGCEIDRRAPSMHAERLMGASDA